MTEADTYRNQSTDLQSKSMDWFLYDIGLCHERVKRSFFFFDLPISVLMNFSVNESRKEMQLFCEMIKK